LSFHGIRIRPKHHWTESPKLCCPQNYKFEGKERDTETGKDDFGARYYSNRFGPLAQF